MPTPSGYVMLDSGYWYKPVDQSGPYIFDGSNMALAGGSPIGTPAYAAKLPRWRSALARVRANKGDARIAVIGDSTTTGLGANPGSSGYAGSKALAVPQILTNLLVAQGTPARSDGIYGDNNSNPNLAVYDPRITLNGWTVFLQLFAPGGNALYCTGNTTPLAIVFGIAMDSLEITFRRGVSNGQFSVNINGGAALTPAIGGTGGAAVDTSGTAGVMGYAKFTFPKTAPTDVINIQRNGTGGDVILLTLIPNDSTVSKVIVANMGISGAKASTFSGGAPLPTKLDTVWNNANAYKPDLTIFNLGINDWLQGTTIPAFMADMQTLITAAKTTGDVLLQTEYPGSVAATPAATQQAFFAAIYQLASANNIGVIDIAQRMQSYEVANSLGWYFDVTHPNALGYADAASEYARAVSI